MKLEKMCNLCGQTLYAVPEGLKTFYEYAAAVIAIKRAGRIAAQGQTDEAFNNSLKHGDIDPNNVCHRCITNEDGELLE